MAYQDYLRSQEWELLRRQRLAMDAHECVLCGEPAREVHHRRYPKNYGEETVMDLISLCSRCHAHHHRADGEAITLPPRIEPTGELKRLKITLREAADGGDEKREAELLSLYVNTRRAQVVGARPCYA